MGKVINFKEENLFALKESIDGVDNGNVANKNDVVVKEAAPEVDEYEIGQESNNPPIGGNFCHVNESYNVSLRGNIEDVNTIEFIPHENAKEEGYDDEEASSFDPYYEITASTIDDEVVLYADLTVEELYNYFKQSIINDIVNRNARVENPNAETKIYRIDDILYRDTTPSNLDDVNEVNRIAKKIQTKGPASFLLVDGDVISFQDHIEINNVDGITPSKFIGLGNIRLASGREFGFEIAKEPTREQLHVLRQYARNQNKVRVDIVKDDGNTYPTTICSAEYSNGERALNDIIRYFEEGIRPQSSLRYEAREHCKKLMENIDFEVASSDIDLSSFKKRDTLPPRIWDDENTLNSKVRLRLLDIADDFWSFVNLTWVKPKAILLTGSICNFNWSQYSDIDLHLVVDFKEIDEKTEFVRDYLDSKKNEWNTSHNGLKIYDFPIEMYVQDVDDELGASGIYDIEENKWIAKPNKSSVKPIGLNKFGIKQKAAEIMTIIDDMYDAFNSSDDSYEIEMIGDDAKYLWSKIKDMRKKSLEKNGESGSGNIVYKILRRQEYLNKLWQLKTSCYDKTNSINESISHFDMFGAAKKMFGTTNDIRECGFILPNGEMLDFSGRHKANDKTLPIGRRTVYHRSIEDIGNENTPYITLSRFIEAGAIRCDVRGAFINLIKKPTQEQITVLMDFISKCSGNVQLEIGNNDVSLDYVEYKNTSPRKVINDILNFFDNKIKPSSLYTNIRESVENNVDIFALAKERFGTTNDIRECGYVLPDGSMLDFSGRHQITSTSDTSFLKGRRGIDHREIGDLNWDKDKKIRNDIGVNMASFIRKGAIRIHCSNSWSSINLFVRPTKEQINPLLRLIQYSKGNVTVEIGDGDNSYEYAEWDEANPRRVVNDIIRYFDEGINLIGNVSESIEKYKDLILSLKQNINEEFNADGSSNGNPYAKRWKAERQALKNFICNYGVLMQSKEDDKQGKLYKCFWDKTLSNLIGYNYCLAVQWDEINNKPKSTIYVRACDRFTRNIRRNLQWDNRGQDNVNGTNDDINRRNY